MIHTFISGSVTWWSINNRRIVHSHRYKQKGSEFCMDVMATFTCSRCGRCCQNFGPYLRIERELDEGHYYCHCSLSNEHFFARVDRELERDFVARKPASEGAYPCPFLCQEDTGAYRCAIYPSRPGFCREYRCSNIDILDLHGKRLGRVGGKRSLVSKDPELMAVWQKEIQPLQEQGASWNEKVKRTLQNRGYRVVVYE
jgi:Fe-S-cluster containining protein